MNGKLSWSDSSSAVAQRPRHAVARSHSTSFEFTSLSRACVSSHQHPCTVAIYPYRFWDILRRIMRAFEIWAKGRSKSLKMATSDRSYATSYWYAIVSIALFYFRVIWHWRLSVTLRGHSRSLERHHSITTVTTATIDIMYYFQNKARHWLEISTFSYPTFYKTTPWEKRLQIFSRRFFTTKPDPWPIRWCEKILQKSSVYSQLMRVKDRRTDRHGQT